MSLQGKYNCRPSLTSYFPITSGAYYGSNYGALDVFVSKLNATGSTLQYSTFIGGSRQDFGNGIAVDGYGNAIITGNTLSFDFPSTICAYDSSINGFRDVFVTKLNSSGTNLMYSTFLGGSETEEACDITIDSSGNSYITGYTFSSDFPITAGAYDVSFNGNKDVFITRLNHSGNIIEYSTFLGGNNTETARGIAVGENNTVYITGYTVSSDFPVTSGAFDETHNGRSDVFVTKLVLEPLHTSNFIIHSINDIPNDQGKQVRISWTGHLYDTIYAAEFNITKYSIWRKIDHNLPQIWKPAKYPEGDWDFLKEVPAVQIETYNTIVPNLADSTINNGIYYSKFFVMAHTSNPQLHFETVPDSGYSVDNLCPPAVAKIAIIYKPDGNYISWDESNAPDLSHYEVHKGIRDNFIPDESTLIGSTVETYYLDESGEVGEIFYKIATYDFSGNSSISHGAEITVGISETPVEFHVNEPYPNPFNPAVTIEYSLPQESDVSLIVYDILGREIAVLQDGRMSSGVYKAVWDGKNRDGLIVGSGVYLYRFKTGSYKKNGKIMFLR